MAESNEQTSIEDLLGEAAWLRRLAGSLVADAGTADDLVQDTWVAAMRRPPAQGANRTWLQRVARNLTSNLVRSRERRASREVWAGEDRARQAPITPEQAACEAELQRLVAEEVTALPEPLRTVVVMRYFRGLDSSEIARMLGLPPGTVRWRLKRAIEHLREALDARRRDWVRALAPLLGPWPGPASLAIVAGGLLVKKALVLVSILGVLGLVWSTWPEGRESAPAATSTMERRQEAAEVLATVAPSATQRVAAVAGPETPPARGSLLVRVRWSDGTPAARVGLHVHPLDDPRSGRNVRLLVTDEGGEAIVEGVHAGRVLVRGDRAGEVQVEVQAGERTVASLELALGVDVEGRVSDDAGAPVVGAEILLVAPGDDDGRFDWLSVRVVGRTAADGSYFVRDVDPIHRVSARAPGYSYGLLESLEDSDAGRKHVDFSLSNYGMTLTGVVRDPEGRAVAGALVAVGPNEAGTYRTLDGSRREGLGMAVVETGADGSFRAYGIRQSRGLEMDVAVMARDYPLWSGAVAGDLHSTAFVEIVLELPGAIEGVVRDERGDPVPGAWVRELAPDVAEEAGGVFRGMPFPLAASTTDEQGSYHMELLHPGRTSILAEPSWDRPGSGSAFAWVDVRLGEVVSRDLVLAAEAHILGRVVDATGSAAVGWTIRAAPQAPGRLPQRKVVTDGEGNFVLRDCGFLPCTLRVYPPGKPTAALVVADVVPGAGERVLRLPEFGSVRGVFVDGVTGESPAGKLQKVPLDARGSGGRYTLATSSGLSLSLRERRGPSAPEPDFSNGQFVFELVPPGEYRLFAGDARAPGSSKYRSGWFTVGPGESVDLGTIVGEEPGRVVVDVRHPGEGLEIDGYVRDPSYEIAGFLEAQDDRLEKELPAGIWFIELEAKGLGQRVEPVEVLAGETVTLTITLEPAVARTVEVRFDGRRDWNELRVRIRGASGSLHLAQRLSRSMDARESVLARLPAGSYEAEVETDTGKRGWARFEVPDLLPQEEPIVVRLR